MEEVSHKQEEKEVEQIAEQLDKQELNEQPSDIQNVGEDDENELDDNSTETIDKIDKLQNVMNKALEIVGLYKNEIDDLKSKIIDMKEIILLRDSQDKERVAPIITQLSQIYREEFSKLIDQNRLLENELITAIKEKQEVVEEIYSCVDKIKLLEQQVFKGEIPPYLKKKLEEQKEQQKQLLKKLQEEAAYTENEQKEIQEQQKD